MHFPFEIEGLSTERHPGTSESVHGLKVLPAFHRCRGRHNEDRMDLRHCIFITPYPPFLRHSLHAPMIRCPQRALPDLPFHPLVKHVMVLCGAEACEIIARMVCIGPFPWLIDQPS